MGLAAAGDASGPVADAPLRFAADPKEAREISRSQVCGANWCNPAYVDGRLFLRDGNRQSGDWMCLALD